MAQNRKNSKATSGLTENGKKSKESTPDVIMSANNNQISAPKYGTVIPDRVFVGGISSNTTGDDLTVFFSKYGKVTEAKVITDRAGVSKGYGFVTFATEEEAKLLLTDADNIMLRERKLNIAHAIKKQSFSQRVENNGGNGVNGSNIFPTGMPYAAYNGMTYFTPPQSQVPTQPTPAAHHHLDPALYSASLSGYSSMQAQAPQYHPVIYNQPIYYPTPQYQYPLSCDGTCESIIDGSSVMLTASNYYMQEVITQPPAQQPQQQPMFTQEYIQPTSFHPSQPLQTHQYQQPPIHDPALIQFSPRRYYDQIIIPEQPAWSGGSLVRNPAPEQDKQEQKGAKQLNNNNPEQANRNLPPPSSQPHPSHSSLPHNQHTPPFLSSSYSFRRLRQPFNQSSRKVKRYSQGGNGYGGVESSLVTPPTTPRLENPPPAQSPSSASPPPRTDLQPSQEHLVKPMHALKAS